MKVSGLLLAFMIGVTPVMAQRAAVISTPQGSSAVIDLDAKPRPFSADDYKQLLSCTVAQHPTETRRYAEYHLFWREVQTPEQNEADPNGNLFFPALEGCLEMADGEVFPFALDRLVNDWGSLYGLPVVDVESLAKCIVHNNRAAALAYVGSTEPYADPQIAKSRKLLFHTLVFPPCMSIKSSFSISENKLLPLLVRELNESGAKQ